MTDIIEQKEQPEVAKSEASEQKPEIQKVPLSDFLDLKKSTKELREKLASYETKEKTAAEAKLLEEKKYQELIEQLKAEKVKMQSEREIEIKNNKLEKLQNKFQRELEKANAVNAEDALKFVNYDDLLESEKAEDEIKKRVEVLVKTKAYLFSAKQRNSAENKSPNSLPANPTSKASKVDPALAMLTNIFNQ